MERIKLDQLDVTALSFHDLEYTEGGELPKWLKGGIIGYVVDGIISNWPEVKQAAIDGWNLK